MKKNHLKKILRLALILIIGSSLFFACKKNTEVESNETFSLDNYKSNYLKQGLTETTVRNELKKNALLYSNKALEDILDDLVSKNKITSVAKSNILASVQGKTQAQFTKGALQRISNLRSQLTFQPKKLSSKNSLSSTQPGPFEPLNDAGFSAYQQQVMFDYIVLELTSKGISWACAGAIAGYGLSIAALFVGGPVTVAAAALWGASHIVGALSLVACIPAQKHYVEEIKNQFSSEQDYITYFETSVGSSTGTGSMIDWTEIPGNFSTGYRTDLFLQDIISDNYLSRIVVLQFDEELPTIVSPNDNHSYSFNASSGTLSITQYGSTTSYNLGDLTAYYLVDMQVFGIDFKQTTLVLRLRN